jgi:hypothetical protein
VWLLCIPNPAYAADKQIDSFMINYDMQPSGVLTSKRNPKMIKLAVPCPVITPTSSNNRIQSSVASKKSSLDL